MVVEHPVLIPVQAGLLGAVVAEPDREPRGAALILPGRQGLRSGPNQIWTRLSRELAGRGVVTLRLDYPGAGDSTERMDVVSSAREAMTWFLGLAGPSRIALVGSCHGARVGLRVADDRTAGVHMIHPHLWRAAGAGRVARLAGRSRRAVDRALPWRRPRLPSLDPADASRLVELARRIPVRVIVGDRDGAVGGWTALARETPGLDVDVVEGAAIRAWGSRRAQQLIVDRTGQWVAELFAGGAAAGVARASL